MRYSEVSPWNVQFTGTWGFYVSLRLTEMRKLNMLSTADLCSHSLKTGAHCNMDFCHLKPNHNLGDSRGSFDTVVPVILWSYFACCT